MKITYRPHKGGLQESMGFAKEFNSVKAMLQYIVKDNNDAFDIEELHIQYYGHDNRIGWDTFIITTERYFDRDYMKEYNCPQAIGFCEFN